MLWLLSHYGDPVPPLTPQGGGGSIWLTVESISQSPGCRADPQGGGVQRRQEAECGEQLWRKAQPPRHRDDPLSRRTHFLTSLTPRTQNRREHRPHPPHHPSGSLAPEQKAQGTLYNGIQTHVPREAPRVHWQSGCHRPHLQEIPKSWPRSPWTSPRRCWFSQEQKLFVLSKLKVQFP